MSSFVFFFIILAHVSDGIASFIISNSNLFSLVFVVTISDYSTRDYIFVNCTSYFTVNRPMQYMLVNYLKNTSRPLHVLAYFGLDSPRKSQCDKLLIYQR